jgi:hypothetical protein
VSRYTFLLISIAGSLALLIGEAGAQTRPARVEEIRVVRSIRLARMQPTEFCSQSRTTFVSATYEDSYSFAAVATRSTDGVVTDAVSRKVGSGHACYERAADPGVVSLYIEVDLGGVRSVGVGKCTSARSDFPEPDLRVISCFANLSGLPAPYVGGLLTTNSIDSRQPLGAESEPPGYVQPSIATVRLWKRREALSR